MESTTNQTLSPFKWMTDTQTYKTTTVLEADTKNKFSNLPVELVSVSSDLLGTSKKLTKTLSEATTVSLQKGAGLDRVLVDPGVRSVGSTATRSNISSYYTFQEGGNVRHRDLGYTTNSERTYDTMPMTKPQSSMFTTRPGVMLQKEWVSEPQIERGGVNTRYAER